MLPMVRSLVEKLVRNSFFRRRLPGEFGRAHIYVSADSGLQFLKPWASRQSMNHGLFVLARNWITEGDHVWDIGANVGVLSFCAAGRVGNTGSVLAVEPDIFLCWLLQKSKIANQRMFPNVSVLSAAVSDKIGFAQLLVANRGRAANSLVAQDLRQVSNGIRYEQNVVTVTLDSLLEKFHAPTLVKIDVEGAESMVLQGASKLLKDIRPKFYIEVGREETQSVTDIFQSNGYVLFDGEAGGATPISKCVFNTLAIPKEKTSGITNR
jgi:FkbM family methyltransferase